MYERMKAADAKLRRLHEAGRGVFGDVVDTARCADDGYEPVDANAVGSSSGKEGHHGEEAGREPDDGEEDHRGDRREQDGGGMLQRDRAFAYGRSGGCASTQTQPDGCSESSEEEGATSE